MGRIAKKIIDHKKLILIIFTVLAFFGIVLNFMVKVNYNMVDYLPKESQSTIALEIMQDEFDQDIPNARVMISDVDLQQTIDYKEKLKEIDGISGVIWLDDIYDLKKPIEMYDTNEVENYYKNGNAIISISIAEGEEVRITNEIYSLIGDDNHVSGNAIDMGIMQKLAGSETLNAILILVPLILIILLISTSSWIEPLLFLASIGVSVLINMGTNVIFGEISFITNAVSPILQLAVSLDYAIFLLHRFNKYRETNEPKEAMQLAIKKSMPAIAASAATTLFGFLALVFMKFTIGSDLGITLVKGIILSFISVMVFLPALTLSLYKLIDKTRHKNIFPKFKSIPTIVSKIKVPVLIMILLLIVPSFLAQNKNEFTYGSHNNLDMTSRGGIDAQAISEEFGESNAIVLLLPKGELAKEEQLVNDIQELEHVKSIMSYSTVVDNTIPSEFLDEEIVSQFYSENYSRVIIYTDTKEEGDEAFALVESVQSLSQKYYGDNYYSLGQSVNLYDMKSVVNKDNTVVNIIAILAILMILIFTFRSLKIPIILLLTIESAIWINLSIPYFTGTALCYIGFLVINTVQLGATVDYAILFTDHYVNNRKTLDKKEAMKKSLNETFSSILISATILAFAGLTLWFTSSNPIVSELGMLLARGTFLSMLLVIAFLPALLSMFDKKSINKEKVIKGEKR
ncbi:MAG: MMPL family transporter [Bacilli bacterium]|nr:MMPL family transporter [Bacilli bacterium]